MRRAGQWLLIGVGCVLAGIAPARADSTDVPVPGEAQKLASAQQISMGASTITVDSFMSRQSEADLVAWYETFLPRYGWRLNTLPWQADQERLTSTIEQKIKTAQHDGGDLAALRKRLADSKDVSEFMRHQVYATRHEEHVLVNLMPVGEGMGIFVNRWTGQAWWNRPQSSTPTNICCSSEAVPTLERTLPFSVPRYPQARPMAQGTSQDTGRIMVVLSSADAADAVASYYRANMPRNGWRLIEDRTEPSASGAEAHVLRYQKPDRDCLLAIQRMTEASAAEPGITNVTVTIDPRSPSAAIR